MDARAKAIIAHFTIIGWIIALILNMNDKHEYTSFYMRQMLGLIIISFVLGLIPIIGWILTIVLFAFWLLSLISAIQGERRVIPFGEHFQEWFASL